MGVHAIQGKIDCDQTTLAHLWRTHCVFNERLPRIVSTLIKMRRGECGQSEQERKLYQVIGRFILARNAKDAPYLLNSVSIRNWKPATALKQSVSLREEGSSIEVSGSAWAPEAAQLSAQGRLLYDKEQVLGDLPDTLRQMIARETVAIISGHDELVDLWNTEHRSWLEEKRVWELDPVHRQYLNIRPQFEAFEKEQGFAGKRRERWHLYRDWLSKNPQLAAWRGGEAKVNSISQEAKQRIARARPWKRSSREAEEFWAVNPELRALDRIHGEYERKFVRAHKRKRNPDGFDHKPTFTLPHAVTHPRWFIFNAPQTSPEGYRNLRLPAKAKKYGSIDLKLLIGKDEVNGGFRADWVRVRFKSDPRLCDFHPCKVQKAATKGAIKGELRDREAYEFHDRQLGITRSAQISGTKLMFRNIRLEQDGSFLGADAYLVFTCNIKEEPVSELSREVKSYETEEVTRKGKRKFRAIIPTGLITCAVDLGARNLGFATIAEIVKGEPQIVRSRNLWIGHEEKTGSHIGRWNAGPTLRELAKHKKKLRRLRRLRGKPVKFEASHTELQDHITDFAEDRFKKGSRKIVNFALNVAGDKNKSGTTYPRADLLILENLATLVPDAEKERGVNKTIIEMNRGNLVDRLKEQCKDVGLRWREVSPVGTSQVCSKCGRLGRRYSIVRETPSEPLDIRFGWVERLFACTCGYRANADHNASVNLHRRLCLGDKAVETFYAWQGKSEKEKAAQVQDLEAQLRPQLRKLHNLQRAAVATPF